MINTIRSVVRAESLLFFFSLLSRICLSLKLRLSRSLDFPSLPYFFPRTQASTTFQLFNNFQEGMLPPLPIPLSTSVFPSRTQARRRLDFPFHDDAISLSATSRSNGSSSHAHKECPSRRHQTHRASDARCLKCNWRMAVKRHSVRVQDRQHEDT